MEIKEISHTAYTFSAGIRKIRNIENFLGVSNVAPPAELVATQSEALCALVWGRKQTARRTLKWAEHHAIPVWFLEDGFIRSATSSPHSRTSYSLIVDDAGVYYDANSANLLEKFLNNDAQFNQAFAENKKYSAHCLQLVLQHNITKYNFCANIPSDHWFARLDKPIVLVADQTRDDASVRYGSMVEQDFVDMLDAAINENPAAHIVVKTHPDVISGRRKGYLTQLAQKRGIKILAEPFNPLSVLKLVNKVYCGTSQIGFEALLCNKPVTLFGLPFYAGWGATNDLKAIPRRTAKRTVEQLFFAAYDWYTRYCNPVTGERWSLEQCLRHVMLQKKYFDLNQGHSSLKGITPWKKKYIQQYLRTPATAAVNHPMNAAVEPSERTVTWGYKIAALAQSDEPMHDAESGAGTATSESLQPAKALWRVEDGFLRGKGLGSDFHAPQSLVFDSRGMYFNSQQSCDLEHILNTRDCDLQDIRRARHLISLIISRGLSKYNVGNKKFSSVFAETRKTARKLLVVGQVENDASLKYGCRDIADNSSLLQAVRQANPDAQIVFKPHPDVVAGNRIGRVSPDLLSLHADAECTEVDIIECIKQCDELHTMTSLSGFEALIRGKQVFTYGLPFYAGWGLTSDRHRLERRVRQRTLEELVYCVLIEYPRYVDFDTGEFIAPEDLVFSLGGNNSMKNNNMTWANRQVLKIKNVYKGLAYAP